MNFRSKFEHQQNQKTIITNYQSIIPDRKLTVKRGVFPYAIHANPVSKREVFKKDQHVSNKNNNFQKSKNPFFCDKKIPIGVPHFENNTKPSISTGFFGSNTQHPATPINFKNIQNDAATFSNATNVTKMNKNVLLNKYVTQQYNAVFQVDMQRPKNTSNLFDKKIPNVGPRFESKTKPSMSTGFFKSNSQPPATPKSFKKPQNDNVTFSNGSNTTKMNKNVLLNQYVTEQYNAVFNANTSPIQPKYINFDGQEALQICTYKQIGEVLNQSFIEASTKFECSLGRTSSIRKHLLKFYKERRKYANDKCDHQIKNIHANLPKKRQHEKKHAKNKTKSVHKEDNALSPKKGSEIRNQFKLGGNDGIHRSPGQCSSPEKNYDWRNLTPLSSPDIYCNFIRNFEKKNQESDLLEKLDDRDVKHKRFPLLPPQQEIFSQNNYPKYEHEAVNSPTLFFSDTEESIITPKVDKSNTNMSSKDNIFSLDSAVFKRKFSPELRNPIDILKCTRRKPERKKTKRKKIVTPHASYSDSTCHGVYPFKWGYEKNRNDEFYTKCKYSKLDLGKDKYYFS